MTVKTRGEKKRSRGRPMEFDRKAAIRAAMDKFWKYGFKATSASDLADAMSIERSSFYNSFGDRETVFREVLAVYPQFAPDTALGDIRPGQPVKPAIRKIFREICRVRAADAEGRGCLVVNAIGELVGENKKLGGQIADAVLGNVRTYEKLLKQAVDQGEIAKPQNIRTAARAFVAFVVGLNTVSKVIRNEDDLWGMCEVFLERFGLGRAREAR